MEYGLRELLIFLFLFLLFDSEMDFELRLSDGKTMPPPKETIRNQKSSLTPAPRTTATSAPKSPTVA